MDAVQIPLRERFIPSKIIEDGQLREVTVGIPLTNETVFRKFLGIRQIAEMSFNFGRRSNVEEVFHVFQIARSLATVNNPPSFSVIVRKILPQNLP